MKQTRRFEDVTVGEALPPLDVATTTSIVVGGALASRDFTPVHHDKAAAQAQGLPDVFMNILTTNGFVGRYVTDWAGPDARIRGVKLADLRLMQEKFARRFRLMILAIAEGIFVDVRVVEKSLAVLNARECVRNLGFARAQGFDLGAVQDDARFERIEDVVIAAGFGIGNDVRHLGAERARGAD